VSFDRWRALYATDKQSKRAKKAVSPTHGSCDEVPGEKRCRRNRATPATPERRRKTVT
jgi:hypothetical protein